MINRPCRPGDIIQDNYNNNDLIEIQKDDFKDDNNRSLMTEYIESRSYFT